MNEDQAQEIINLLKGISGTLNSIDNKIDRLQHGGYTNEDIVDKLNENNGVLRYILDGINKISNKV